MSLPIYRFFYGSENTSLILTKPIRSLCIFFGIYRVVVNFWHVLTYMIMSINEDEYLPTINIFYQLLNLRVHFRTINIIINLKWKFFVVQKKEIGDILDILQPIVYISNMLLSVLVYINRKISIILKKFYSNNFQFTFLFDFMLSSTFFIQHWIVVQINCWVKYEYLCILLRIITHKLILSIESNVREM